MYQHPQGHVFYRYMKHPRPKIAYGEGIYLYDESGKRYIDGSGGPFVVNVGHGRKEVVEAMSQQAQSVAYVHANMFTSEPIEQYSAELAKIVPMENARFFYLSSGSEVVEGALKLARQIQMARGETGRHRIISRHQSYHGMSFGALSVSGRPGLRAPYADMLPSSIHIDPPYPYRDSRSGEELAHLLEQAILENGAETIAAFIAEPINGAGLGACIPPEDYWSAIREICNRYGVLLIADEVFVGLGRTGKWWGINHWNVTPDILVTSKGTAGGYFPFGFIAAHGSDVDRIYRTLGDFNHGGTFSHHAVGAAAALATLDILQRENLVENSARQGVILGQLLHEAFDSHPHIGDIRGRGLFWTLEIVQDRATKHPFPASNHTAQKLMQHAFDAGLIVYHAQGCVDGQAGDLIHIGPPLIVAEPQLREIVLLLQGAVEVTFKHSQSDL
jgi:adenosylmethionine-8-amino-7-oxononanoate aminotransferase